MLNEAGVLHGLLRLPSHSSRQLSPAIAQHLLSVLLPCGDPAATSMPPFLPLWSSPAPFPACDDPFLLKGLPSFVSSATESCFLREALLSLPGSLAELSFAWKKLLRTGHTQSKHTRTCNLPSLSLPRPIVRTMQEGARDRWSMLHHLVLRPPPHVVSL